MLLFVNRQVVLSCHSNPHGQDQYMQLIEMWIEATMFSECHVYFPTCSHVHLSPSSASCCKRSFAQGRMAQVIPGFSPDLCAL